MNSQSRRSFLLFTAKAIGVAVVASTVGCGSFPRGSGASPSFLSSDSTCGNKGGSRVLVAYATKYGSTKGVAETIGRALCQQGFNADIKWLGGIKDLRDYDAAIIGAPIHYDKWMGEAREFVTENQEQLKKIPWHFSLRA